MEVKVEKIGLSSLDAVIPLFDLYRQFYGQESDTAVAREFLTVRVANDESVIYVARDGQGNALGFTQLYPSFSSVSARRIWILNDLFVSEDARGKGVGKALMNAARLHATQTFAKGLALSTQKDNASAQAVYESLGYKKDDEFFHYFLTL
ncbi:GNAT family N-acetyltransferase [Parasalinivibrio latis]|uniref:GNAT family N-acetyltransferase n=1 Tax=Parasalinivibrio latis TaxID=2952610 RepID=UPI0030E418FE